MPAYATVQDVQARMLRTMSSAEEAVCANLLDDAGVIIDAYNADASANAKKVVSCNMVVRAMGDGELTTDLLKTTGFGVYCWYTENNDFTTPRASTYMLMRNQEVTWASNNWTYSPLKYWPETPDELLTFRAYAPYTDAELSYDDNGMPRLPVSVAADDYTNGTQHDPLFGTTQNGLLYTDYNYLKSGSTATSDDTDGTIHWYFHHGMAKLVFKAAINPKSTIEKLTITGITVTPLYDEGILDISSTAFNTTTNTKDKPTWYDRDGRISADITFGEDKTVELVKKATAPTLDDYVSILNGNGLLVIPRHYGETTNDDPTTATAPMTITVSYQVEGSTETKTATATINKANIQGNTVYTFYLLLDPSINDTLTLIEVGIRTWTKAADITHDVYNW